MADLFKTNISQEEQKEIKEFISTLISLPKEDRAVLLSNANAFRVRSDIEKSKKEKAGV